MKKQTYKEWLESFTHYGIGGVLDENGNPIESYIPILRSLYLGVDRFIEAQNRYNTYQKALEEVKRLDNLYDCADEDMQPSIIYKIKGYQAEYTALCRRIKKEIFNS